MNAQARKESEKRSGPYCKRFRVTTYAQKTTEKTYDVGFRSLPIATTMFQRQVALCFRDADAAVVLTLDYNDVDQIVAAGTVLASKSVGEHAAVFNPGYYNLLESLL